MPSKLNFVVLRDISFEYPQGAPLFHNLSYSFQPETVALVGANGVGKSTLAELLKGTLAPTSGEILKSREVQILYQEEERPELRVSQYLLDIWENPLLDPSLWLPLIENINQDQMLKSLSGGEWMRLRLVKSLSVQPALLILDEPTNNLDQEGREHIYRFIKNYSEPLLVITHDRALLEKVSKILELSSLGLKVYGGNFDFFEKEKQNAESLLDSRIDSAKLEKSRAERHALERVKTQENRNRKAHEISLKGGMPRILRGALKRRAEVTLGKVSVQTADAKHEVKEKLIELQSQQKVSYDFALEFQNLKLPAGKTVFELQDFNMTYTQQKHWLWSENLTWSFRGPERWALLGKNGAGKSSLVKAICGIDHEALTKGQLNRGLLNAAYLDQNYSLLNPEVSLLENIQEVSDLGVVDIRNKLARFQFVAEKALRPVQQLSGGEKLKASLAKILLNRKPIQFLILDEPTNNLDLESLEILTESVRAYKGALLVISHDSAFLDDLELEGRVELKGPGIAF